MAVGFVGLIQLGIGTDVIVLFLAVTGSIIGLAGFRLAGAYNSAGWLALVFVHGNLIVAMIAKTVFVQPLDSHLYAPLESFLVLATGCMVLSVCVAATLLIPVGRPLFKPVKQLGLLRFLSQSTFFVGIASWYFSRMFQDPGQTGYAGASVFWNLLLMSVIARTALILEQTDDRRSVDIQLVLILAVCVAVGLIDNAKTKIALPLVAYFATCVFYRRRITFRQLGLGVGMLLVMSIVVTPMVHAYRVFGIQDLPWERRLTLLQTGLKEAFLEQRFDRYERLGSARPLSGYYNYFAGTGEQLFLGRFASIQQNDPVIAEVNKNGTLGGRVIWPALLRLLPNVLYEAKPKQIEAYYIGIELGLIEPEGGKFPTIPLLAQSYAGYGALGVVLIPFFAFLLVLLALKKLNWNLHRNVFAIFFYCVFVVLYAYQGDFSQYVGAVLRTFPLLALSLGLLVVIYTAFSAPRFRAVGPHARPLRNTQV